MAIHSIQMPCYEFKKKRVTEMNFQRGEQHIPSPMWDVWGRRKQETKRMISMESKIEYLHMLNKEANKTNKSPTTWGQAALRPDSQEPPLRIRFDRKQEEKRENKYREVLSLIFIMALDMLGRVINLRYLSLIFSCISFPFNTTHTSEPSNLFELRIHTRSYRQKEHQILRDARRVGASSS